MTHDTIGYYWDGKNSFIIEEHDHGKTRIIKQKYEDVIKDHDFDAQVAEARKMQKEIYG
tara:strand:+ start:222 stop:398 length:177 start_codon:yes stop_codon:yes gene_type:complete